MCFPNTQGLSPPLPSPWYRVNRPSRGESPGTEMTMSHFCVCPAKRGQSQQATEGPASPSGPAWAFKRRTSSSGMQSVASREQAGFRHPCPAQTTTSDAVQPTIPVSPGLGLILCSRNKNHRRWSVQSIALGVWDAFRRLVSSGDGPWATLVCSLRGDRTMCWTSPWVSPFWMWLHLPQRHTSCSDPSSAETLLPPEVTRLCSMTRLAFA